MIDHVTLMSPVRIEGRVTTILHPSSAGQYPLVSTSSPAEGFAERSGNARRPQQLCVSKSCLRVSRRRLVQREAEPSQEAKTRAVGPNRRLVRRTPDANPGFIEIGSSR